MKIEIEKISEDRLSKEVWCFYFRADTTSCVPKMRLDNYYQYARKLARGRYSVALYYETWDGRHNTIKDPPLPDDIVARAKDILKQTIDEIEITK
jgi:hypothetical protein